MGFYLRKTVKAGPFRFNLSKSGLGVSAGVPGFRVGTGPRGNYVTVGSNGIYYRATLGGSRYIQPNGASPAPVTRLPDYRPSGIVMEDTTGTEVLAMEPTGGGDVVDQLNSVSGRLRFGWPAGIGVFVLGLLVGMPWGIAVWVVLAPACAWLILWEQARRKVVLFYDVNDAPATWFSSVVDQWEWLVGSQKLWREVQAGAVTTTHQFKTNAGASNVVNRITTTANTSGPVELATNIAVPTVTAGKAALYFLPDRILVRDGKTFSDVAYSHIGIRSGQTRFIENSAPPGDAVQVDHTWRYVNVKGGPDRRYKDNPVLPIMLYGTIDLASTQGLRWDLQTSRKDAAAAIARILSSSPTSTAPVKAAPAAAAPPHLPKQRDPQPAAPPRPKSTPAAAPRLHTAGPGELRAPERNDAGFLRAQLTRTSNGKPATEAVFTALDIETTGLDPDVDRIVEIGVVKFTADGTVIDEFATLVNNPGSSPGAREKHEIDDADLVGAPTAEQALREVFAFITGTVLVAHQLDFEDGFLAAEARRAGLPLPPVVGICTWQTSRRQLDGRAFSLFAMYKTATGDWHDHQHTALGDARAARDVLLWLLRTTPTPLHLSRTLPATQPSAYEACPISCRPVPLTRASIASLLDSFPQSPNNRDGDAVETEKYLGLLAEAVEDGRLTYEEADALTRQARRTRLTGSQLRRLHRRAWDEAFLDVKNMDWASLEPVRRREMYLLAEALGLPELASQVNEVILSCAEPKPPEEARYLKGVRIAIVGDGEEINALRKRAETYGTKLAVKVTKTVLWLATDTPDATDSRHTSARTLGIPIVDAAEGTARLAEAIREAELKAFERQRQIDEHNARRRKREIEDDAYWRPTWRDRELDKDPEFEPWYD
jgi:DNA polymerase III epsilon subunit-like protein